MYHASTLDHDHSSFIAKNFFETPTRTLKIDAVDKVHQEIPDKLRNIYRWF